MSDPELHGRRGHRSSRTGAGRGHGDAHHPHGAGAPGRSTGVTSPLPARLGGPSRDCTGHYVGELSTAEINQAERTIVGRVAVQMRSVTGRPVLHRYHITAELGWDNAGSTGFRGQATRDGHGGGHSPIELVFSGERVAGGRRHLVINLSHAPTTIEADGLILPGPDRYDPIHLDRRSSAPAESDGTVAIEAPLDAGAETAGLTSRATRAITSVITPLRNHLGAFYAAGRGTDRMIALASVDHDIETAYAAAALPAEQQELFRLRLRQALAETPVELNGVRWNLLDFLANALARADSTCGQRAATRLGLPFGAAAAADRPVHRYTFEFYEVAAGTDVVRAGPSVGFRVGSVTIRELPGPASERGWERSFPIARGHIGFGLGSSGGASAGGVRTAHVETTDPWRPEDFIGLIGGGSAHAGISGDLGPEHTPDVLDPSDGVLVIHGNGLFEPIALDETEGLTLGAEYEGGAGVELESGRIGLGGERYDRAAATGTPVPTAVRVPADSSIEVAFDTDETTLTEVGWHALREVLAWNRALLMAPGAMIVVDGYASRLGDRAHNRELSRRRRAMVMRAIRAAMPELPLGTIVEGEAEGETAAEEMGVGDSAADPDFNGQHWRRAEVSINGTLCLSLYGAPGADHVGDDATIDAEGNGDDGAT